MANTNSASFSMDAFLADIKKNTKAKPIKRTTGKTVDSPQADFSLPKCSQSENKSTQKNGGLGDLAQRAVCARETVDEKLRETTAGNSEFSEVFCNPDRQREVLGASAPIMIEREKVAAYIRVSTDSSDQENSYETQERYFNQLLASNPKWVPVGIYSDYGISGTSKDKRTGFKRLLRHCKEGRIDRIICKSISRFARNTADFLEALQVLKDNDVTIYFEKECLDTANPMNDFVVTTLAAVAQQETYSISENIRLGIDKRFQNGEAQNAEIYGYRFNGKFVTMDSGYKYRDVEIIEDEAAVVRRIFEEVADGSTYVQVATGLNADGIPAPKSKNARKKGKGILHEGIDQGWTPAQVSRIVNNERYVGDVKVQKTFTENCLTHKVRVNKGDMPQYVIRNHHPAIVDRELYERTMDYLNAHKPRHIYKKEYHELSGMLVCGHCGRFFNVRSNRDNPIWFCPSTALNNGKFICGAERVYEKQVELMLRKAIAERFDGETQEKADDPVGNLKSTIEAYAATRKGFVAKMQARLEAVQKHDNTERDRAYFGKQLTAIRLGNESMEKRIAYLTTQKEAMLTRRELLQDGSVTDEMLSQKDAQIKSEEQRLSDGKAEEAKTTARFEVLEDYWEALEESYEEREKAIHWMDGLSDSDFYDGLLAHLKAFVFTITVHSATHFTIHWFDDSTSDVKMESNVDGGLHKKF